MEYRFIEIGNRMLDYRRYKNEAALLRQIVIGDIAEYFEQLGFEMRRKRKQGYDRAELVLYNGSLDIEIKVEMRKKGEERFV